MITQTKSPERLAAEEKAYQEKKRCEAGLDNARAALSLSQSQFAAAKRRHSAVQLKWLELVEAP
jgi:hypothetical protein